MKLNLFKSNFFKLVLLSSFVLGLNSACSRSRSEFQLPNTNPNNGDFASKPKPNCDFPEVNNCWQESIKILQDVSVGYGWGSDGSYLPAAGSCKSFDNKLYVNFDSPVDFFNKNLMYLTYHVLRGANDIAFTFDGTKDNFTITNVSGYKGYQIRFKKLADGSAEVHCLSGENFNVKAVAFTSGGCANHTNNVVPGIYINSDFQKELEFGFLGIPSQPKLFKCIAQ